MKRIAFRLLAVVMAFAVVSTALVYGAAQESLLEKRIRYSFDGVEYTCVASAERDDQAKKGETFLLTFSFGSVAEPITAQLAENGFSLDNSQPGMEHVYRQEIWNVFGKYFFELYRFGFGRDMVGRTLGGATRELNMHYWMFQIGDQLKRIFEPINFIMGKVPPFTKLVNLVNSLYSRAVVTELGPTDGSDANGYIFEQANSDMQCLLLYGLDFLSLDFMNNLVDYTDRMEPDARNRLDQLFFHPNSWEKRAEKQAAASL